MAQQSGNTTIISWDDTLSPMENWQKKKPRGCFTYAQCEEMEKAFLKSPYLKPTDKETLASSIGLSPSQVQNWFQNRRNKWQRERQAMVQSPSSLLANQTNPLPELTISVYEKEYSKDEYVQQISTLKNELNSERIKSSGFREQLNNLRCQYDCLVFEKNKMAQELDEGRFMIKQLNERIVKLVVSNQNLRQSLNNIAANIKNALQ